MSLPNVDIGLRESPRLDENGRGGGGTAPAGTQTVMLGTFRDGVRELLL